MSVLGLLWFKKFIFDLDPSQKSVSLQNLEFTQKNPKCTVTTWPLSMLAVPFLKKKNTNKKNPLLKKKKKKKNFTHLKNKLIYVCVVYENYYYYYFSSTK